VVVDALSADVAVDLGLTADLSVLGRTMSVSGDATFRGGVLRELHARVAPGDISVGGVTLGGDGKCVTSLVTANPQLDAVQSGIGLINGSVSGGRGLNTGRGSAAATSAAPPTSLVATGATSGPCIQVDWVANASPPVRVGVRGTLSGSGFTAKVFGLLDNNLATLGGSVDVGSGAGTAALGRLEVAGVLWFAGSTTARIANANGTMVRPAAGDWRVDGTFAASKALGPLSSRWKLALGSVSGTGFATFDGDVTLFGTVPLTVTGAVSAGPGGLQYDLRATSALQAEEKRLPLDPVTDTVVRGALALSGVRFDSDKESRRNEEVRGSIMGVASYRFDVRLSRAAGLKVTASGSARVRYAEGFRRRGSSGSFTLEPSSNWNTIAEIGLDVDSQTGTACFSTRFADQPFRFGTC
jgi:hypothetical protein